MKILDLILELGKYGISGYWRYDKGKDVIIFEVPGFSKSGNAELYSDSNGNIICETRYGTIDQIYDLKDLVEVNYRWYQAYSTREPFNGRPSEWGKLYTEILNK